MRTKPPTNGYKKSFPLKKDKQFLALNSNERRFVYNIFLKPKTRWSNARCYKDAYMREDITDNHAYNKAYHLLRKAKIVRCIKKLQRYEIDRLNITAERVLKEESRIAFVDIAELFDENGFLTINPKDLPLDIRKAISGIEVISSPIPGQDKYKVKFWDKGAALSRLQKVLGLESARKVELTGKDGGAIQINHTFDLDLSSLSDDELSSLIRIAEKVKKHVADD